MSSSLSALLKRSTITDHEEVIKACNVALKQSKNDLVTQHAKVVALLKLDRFDDSLRLFEEGGDRLKAAGRLEYAYALYKAGDLQAARRVATGLDSRGAKHVEAQASYRLEDFHSARKLYTQLSKDGDASGEESDLRINGSATDAQLEWKRQGHLASTRKAGREDLEAFETAYNAACACIARGELSQGNILLKRAKDLCASSSELTEDEKKLEALPISVQQIYVLSALEKSDEAEALLKEIDIEEIPDLSTRQSAQINQLSISSKPSNPYLAHRIFHSLPRIPKTDKLFEFQESLMKQNEVALDLMSSKFNGVIRSTDRFLSEQSLPTISPVVNQISAANVAAHTQNKLGKLGLKSVLPLLEKRPNDVGLLATIIQLYMLTKNHGAAIKVLEGFFKHLDESESELAQDVRHAPGLIALLVSLYSIERRKAHIRTELAKAASYWRRKSKSSPSLLREAGLSLLKTGQKEDFREAGEIFSTLHVENPKDKLATAGLVASYATTEPSKIAKEAEQLTAINRLIAGVDVAALEKAGMPQAAPTASSILSRKRPAADDGNVAKKRVRKSRLPKNYDPSKKPDPERWLPLRDRSTYKPKGKKGKQKQAAATQGGVNEKTAEGLNASNETAKASAISGGGGGKSKKKKSKK